MNRCRREERHSEHEQMYAKTILHFQGEYSVKRAWVIKVSQCHVKDLELYSLRIDIH